eukprot:TRINITY_DN8134_c3_g1_i2.p1 TRINITY_DN8134_c3_g1~~TRINITY_DN8134_c3_g1_i2.p1  ORF type:complete len:336 (+),score=41.32 TRINITY_DN8134_c3_g1_i2:142-1008(+)
MAPEALVPIWGPWWSQLYSIYKHQFNVFCAWLNDPSLETVIQLFGLNPRTTQFTLAALRSLREHGDAAKSSLIDCLECREERLGDEVMRSISSRMELFSEVLHRRAITQGGRVSHVYFTSGRHSQAFGRIKKALINFKATIQGGSWDGAAWEAQREIFTLKGGGYARIQALLSPERNKTINANTASEFANALAWLHQRPHFGTSFHLQSLCAAEEWFRRAARMKGAEAFHGALYVGFSEHFGLCSGEMTKKGLQLAARWYGKAIAWSTEQQEATVVLAKRLLSALRNL